MSLAVKGKIDQILKPESGTSRAGKEWTKQEFVIETEPVKKIKKINIKTNKIKFLKLRSENC